MPENPIPCIHCGNELPTAEDGNRTCQTCGRTFNADGTILISLPPPEPEPEVEDDEE